MRNSNGSALVQLFFILSFFYLTLPVHAQVSAEGGGEIKIVRLPTKTPTRTPSPVPTSTPTLAPTPVPLQRGIPIGASVSILNNGRSTQITLNPKRGMRRKLIKTEILEAAALEGGGELGVYSESDESGGGTSAALLTTGNVKIIATEITYSGNSVPVRLEYKLGSGAYNWIPAPDTDVVEPSQYTIDLGTGTDPLTFRASAAYPSFANPSLHSMSAESNQPNGLALCGGFVLDALLATRGYGTQPTLRSVLSLNGLIDVNDVVTILPNQMLVLFELGTSNPNSSAYDFQDLVILSDLTGPCVEGDVDMPLEALGAFPVPDSTPVVNMFRSVLVRGAPKLSTAQDCVGPMGILYHQRYQVSTASALEDRLIACIAPGPNPAWASCLPAANHKDVYVRQQIAGDTEITAMDMAVGRNGSAAVVYQETTTAGAVKWVVRRYSGSGNWTSLTDVATCSASSGAGAAVPNDVGIIATSQDKYKVVVGFPPGSTNRMILGSPTTSSLAMVEFDGATFASGPVVEILPGSTPLDDAGSATDSLFEVIEGGSSTVHVMYSQGGQAKVWSYDGATSWVRTIPDGQSSAGVSPRAARVQNMLVARTKSGLYDVPFLNSSITVHLNTPGAYPFDPFWIKGNEFNTSLVGVSALPGSAREVTIFVEPELAGLPNAININDPIPAPTPRCATNISFRCPVPTPSCSAVAGSGCYDYSDSETNVYVAAADGAGDPDTYPDRNWASFETPRINGHGAMIGRKYYQPVFVSTRTWVADPDGAGPLVARYHDTRQQIRISNFQFAGAVSCQ